MLELIVVAPRDDQWLTSLLLFLPFYHFRWVVALHLQFRYILNLVLNAIDQLVFFQSASDIFMRNWFRRTATREDIRLSRDCPFSVTFAILTVNFTFAPIRDLMGFRDIIKRKRDNYYVVSFLILCFARLGLKMNKVDIKCYHTGWSTQSNSKIHTDRK